MENEDYSSRELIEDFPLKEDNLHLDIGSYSTYLGLRHEILRCDSSKRPYLPLKNITQDHLDLANKIYDELDYRKLFR